MRLDLRTFTLALLPAGLLLSIASRSTAAIIQFDDRFAWEAAAGAPTAFEDFTDFTEDTPFRVSPVDLDGMSIVELGPSIIDRNFVDVPPLLFGGVNGTSALEVAVDTDTIVEITFDSPVSAWGGDFVNALGVGLLTIDVLDTNGFVIGSLTPITDGFTFLGFLATGGDRVSSVQMRGLLEFEGFNADNLALVAAQAPPPPPNGVFEPSTSLLLGAGAAAVGFLGRRRNRADRDRL